MKSEKGAEKLSELGSPSARRVLVEMLKEIFPDVTDEVTLREEGVG